MNTSRCTTDSGTTTLLLQTDLYMCSCSKYLPVKWNHIKRETGAWWVTGLCVKGKAAGISLLQKTICSEPVLLCCPQPTAFPATETKVTALTLIALQSKTQNKSVLYPLSLRSSSAQRRDFFCCCLFVYGTRKRARNHIMIVCLALLSLLSIKLIQTITVDFRSSIHSFLEWHIVQKSNKKKQCYLSTNKNCHCGSVVTCLFLLDVIKPSLSLKLTLANPGKNLILLCAKNSYWMQHLSNPPSSNTWIPVWASEWWRASDGERVTEWARKAECGSIKTRACKCLSPCGPGLILQCVFDGVIIQNNHTSMHGLMRATAHMQLILLSNSVLRGGGD